MDIRDKRRRVRLSLEVEQDLHRRVKIAAARRDMTIKDYVRGPAGGSGGGGYGGPDGRPWPG